jgi:hypothetical protein
MNPSPRKVLGFDSRPPRHNVQCTFYAEGKQRDASSDAHPHAQRSERATTHVALPIETPGERRGAATDDPG